MKAGNREWGMGNRAADVRQPPYPLSPISYALSPERSDA